MALQNCRPGMLWPVCLSHSICLRAIQCMDPANSDKKHHEPDVVWFCQPRDTYSLGHYLGACLCSYSGSWLSLCAHFGPGRIGQEIPTIPTAWEESPAMWCLSSTWVVRWDYVGLAAAQKKPELLAHQLQIAAMCLFDVFVHRGWVFLASSAVLNHFVVACVRTMWAKPSSLCSCRLCGEPNSQYLVKSVIQFVSVVQSNQPISSHDNFSE